MKHNNCNTEKQYRQLMQNPNGLNLKSYQAYKELERKLGESGIARSKRGPKITEPGHIRTAIYR